VERAITGFHQDDEGDWVAELSCGHNQHVRHRPPFQVREWVTDPTGRTGRIGTLLECPLCDRGELPLALRYVRTSQIWDETTLPAGLQNRHRLGASTWGQLKVHDGRLSFVAPGQAESLLEAGDVRGIAPEFEHEVHPVGSVRCSIDFWEVDRSEAIPEEGGDPACWAGLLCPECGAIVERGWHRPGCSLG
jgi:tellurite methyltransferase